ncbi:hypothetical protein BDV24DRAFT_109529 [Aspergillus arachidicola]|uniref:Protein kinase domain-containing protein n=1 Tax=Aspergillus arachidicola TaxID=656916 RepID=A0A5N6XU63_9EURO|nr:hypothetical protein BDV24DRAFT_109529 [Aspergillus arachidicola]
MNKEDSWVDLFFSSIPPDFVNDIKGDQHFQPFRPDDENWRLGGLADKTRWVDENKIQVFWLVRNGRKKYIGKIFPDYTEKQAVEQLYRIRIPKPYTPQIIGDAVHEFDRFYREARAYSHIDQFCPRGERVYFPKFHGVVTEMPRSRFSSGYAKKRAIVLEAIRPKLCSRRILAEDAPSFLEDFSGINPALSTFEREWYSSLLNDRLRRLEALHRIGVTHGDVKDCHFRLPGDMYDTVLYDFSESYTFSPKWPFRVNSGRPRPLRRISEGERKRVRIQVEERANSRDFRSHLINLSSQNIVDGALYQSLDEEKELLELVLLKVYNRPDYFSMPTLNSVFPFLEKVCPKSDPGWCIRRGRLLRYYESVWAVPCDNVDRPASILFNGDMQFETVELRDSPYYILCLIPRSWNLSWRTDYESTSTNRELGHKLRQACLLLVSFECSGYVFRRSDFEGITYTSSLADCSISTT